MKKSLQLFALLIFCTAVSLSAQSIKLSGKITEVGSQKTLPGVGLIVVNAKDSTERHLTTTDNSGNFAISGLKPNSVYLLKTSYISFAEIARQIQTKTNDLNIGNLALKQKSQLLNDVVIEGQKTPVVQKGDTTEMSAAAYKVNVDANAQDLVTKMPGITVENGVIKAHGEEIKRVLVDGKKYFGDDASLALQNLPAEVIDKVQVYNKLSDQAEFTGFDDGNSDKVINIVTRVDRRSGENGTFTVGHDLEDKYMVSGRLNIFRGNRRLTITGGTNNVNQQNFSTQDILGVMGGTRGGRSGSGGFVGRQSGLNKPSAIGINYTDYLGKKVILSGSYFFNKQDNFTDQTSTSENITGQAGTTQVPRFQNQNSISSNKNYNHRFDMRLEYNIDSANSIIWAPRFSTQKNNSTSSSQRLNFNDLSTDTIQFVNSNGSNEGDGYNYASDLTVRHKFAKKGRTISLGATISGNFQNSDGLSYSLTKRITRPDSIIDQRTTSKTDGSTLSANLAYTEPLGINSILQFSYNTSFTTNNTNKYSYDRYEDSFFSSEPDSTYSNVYKNHYDTQRGGISYRVRGGEKLMANAGVDYQLAALSGERTYPSNSKVDKTFDNFLPNAMMNYKFSKKANLRVFYRTSTNPPSINQLQDVITVSNLLNFSQGNPDLKHEYTHNGAMNFRFSNPDKFTNFGFNVFGNYTRNPISNAIYYVSRDSAIYSGTSSDSIPSGGTLTKPQNFKDSWNTRLFLNYGFLFMPIKCNLNMVGGIGYSKTPGSVNNILRATDQYNITGGLVVASNISQNVDFTLSYTGSYTISSVRYDGDITELGNKVQNTNSETWNHSVSFTSTFTILQRLVLQNTLNEQINSGLGAGYNQSYLLWNASIGAKIFKNKAGQIKLAAYDLLNQNQSVSHSVSLTSISDSRTNILRRFLMLTFTYTLRNYQGGGDGERERHRDGFGGGGGRFGGPPPGGGGPGGF
jgi:hypothetical protein